jgi:hypothetical protein
MQEQRPAQSSDLAAFKDGWDEYDFADLVVGDHVWSALYNDEVESVADFEEQELERLALDIIAQPEFVDHILGYVYYREARYPAVGFGALVERLTPYKFRSASPTVESALRSMVADLMDAQVLERLGTRWTFKAGEQFPREKFPELEGFEENARQFLRQCGGEALGRFIALECVEDPESPHHYWAGIRKIVEMETEGIVTHSAGYFALQQTTESWEQDVYGAIESKATAQPESLEEKLGRLRGEHGPGVTRKPRQRRRGWD